MSGSSSIVSMDAIEWRGGRRHSLGAFTLIFIFLIAALMGPSPVLARKLSPFPEKEQTPEKSTVTQASLSATDEEIDKAVARIESRLVDLRKESTSSAESKYEEQARLLTAQPAE